MSLEEKSRRPEGEALAATAGGDSGEKAGGALLDDSPVKWYGYVVLLFGIVIFSGIFQKSTTWLKIFDFNNLLGAFGKLGSLKDAAAGTLAANFKGNGGTAVREGFLTGLQVFPTVMLALGLVSIIEHFDGLRAAQKLLSFILRPLLGIPGYCGLAMISSFQSSDAGAGMTQGLCTTGFITPKERNVFIAFQYAGGGMLTNFLTYTGVLMAQITETGAPIMAILAIVVVGKLLAGNAVRVYEGMLVRRRGK